MNLDIEKIKAAYREWSITDGARLVLPGQEFFAGYKAAIEAYDPDAIRRECAEAAIAWYRRGQIIPAHKESFAIKELRAAIMNAGEE